MWVNILMIFIATTPGIIKGQQATVFESIPKLELVDVYVIEDYDRSFSSESRIEIYQDYIYVANEMQSSILRLSHADGKIGEEKRIELDKDSLVNNIKGNDGCVFVSTTKNLYTITENGEIKRRKNFSKSLHYIGSKNVTYYFNRENNNYKIYKYEKSKRTIGGIFEVRIGKKYNNQVLSRLIYVDHLSGNIYILSMMTPDLQKINVKENTSEIIEIDGPPMEMYKEMNEKMISEVGDVGVGLPNVFYAFDIDEISMKKYAMCMIDGMMCVCEIIAGRAIIIGYIEIVDDKHEKKKGILGGISIYTYNAGKLLAICSTVEYGIIVNTYKMGDVK